MATRPEALSPEPADRRERLFYLIMALAVVATAMTGFGGYLLLGHSSFNAPWWVHVHAVTFVGWLALYVVQTLLIVRGETGRHRRLGAVMVGWAGWMVVVGVSTFVLNTITHRTPSGLTPAMLVSIDVLSIGTFVVLLGAGLLLRGRSDWHRRLILCANIAVIDPGVARIGDLGIPYTSDPIIIHLALVACALVFDLFNRRTVHPALILGGAAVAGMCLAMEPVGALPALVDFTKALGAR